MLTTIFVVSLGLSAARPMFPYIILTFRGILRELPEVTTEPIEAHRGAFEYGTLIAAFMVTRALSAGFAGFLSDVIGRKRTIVAGVLLNLIASAGLMISGDIWTFISFGALQGAASAMIFPVADAYVASIMPRWSRG